MKSRLKLVKPDTENRAVAPTRLANSKYRTREHLTPSEVEKLIEAAKSNRYGHRDATMLLVAYRHGLRASEVCDLERSQIDFDGAALHVRRAKNGKAATHPIRGDGGCPAFLLNIEKRSLPRLMLSGDGLASNEAV
jgi:integrase